MMAKRIAQFHKVSFEQFAEGFKDTFGEMKEGELKEIYQSIKLPKRATYRLQLNNTVGIIDSDYFYSDNEGHIFAKLTNDSNEGKTVELEAGSGFMQGIFVEYGITMDDDVTTVRNGGFGSTSQR